MGRMLCQHLHRVFDALAGPSHEIRVVLLAHTGGLRLIEYSQASETLENRPEVHGRPRRPDDLWFGFDDSHANSGLRQTERIDEADWSATDDYHVLHRAVSGLGRSCPVLQFRSAPPLSQQLRSLTSLLCAPIALLRYRSLRQSRPGSDLGASDDQTVTLNRFALHALSEGRVVDFSGAGNAKLYHRRQHAADQVGDGLQVASALRATADEGLHA